jgi:hypothetical protein
MVQAILEGRKIQTRRVLKLSKYHPDSPHLQPEVITVKDLKVYDGNGDLIGDLKMKYGKPGDVLWVRESFYEPLFEALNGKYYYKADLDKQGWDFKWKPSIHMPKEACRIFLKIKSVRVERLSDISRGDCMAEGCPFPNIAGETNPKAWFYDLWTDINGMHSWLSNPYVWVIEFERIDKPENF